MDPLFSDANWITMGGITGANATVYDAVVEDFSNLQIGSPFPIVGDVFANHCKSTRTSHR